MVEKCQADMDATGNKIMKKRRAVKVKEAQEAVAAFLEKFPNLK